jgi:hypothetical protein
MPYKLSPSALNLMEECPRCFWLLHNKSIKRPEGIFPSLPSGMDRILKIHFDKFMEKGKLPPELAENNECKDCKLFDDKAKLDIWRSNFKGISIQDKEGNILRGAIDNLLVTGNNKLIVLDYKTRGYACKDDTHKHYQNQVDIYNFLLNENGYKTQDYAYLLFYVPKEVQETGEVVFDTKLIKMKIDTNNAKHLWKKALTLLAGPCPKKHEDDSEEICNWCKYIAME